MKEKEKVYIDKYVLIGHVNCTCASGKYCHGNLYEPNLVFDSIEAAEISLKSQDHENTTFRVIHHQEEVC